ncbi:hypothetical protein [Vibrio sp. CAU 1672]|uniref:hypothetical protein n=1 Tax=Vibrio sp. CAU 1672 TaxID=3032594 RepID=UPI0023DA9A2E|nr:hypothetical protein [Vibrio sp. CAU 1672]MDF2153665.1 hypothetical protein [Vibrio sp. CAU 1672]
MWLNQGSYNGHQIVSEQWFDKLKVSRFPGYEMGYGLHFWQIPNVHNAVAAVGIGEQYIVMIPSKEVVIVTTAGNYKAAGHPVLEVVKHVSELL